MKRKTVLVLLLAALVIVAVASFAACTPDVDGKTYVFDSVEIEVTDEGKEMVESMGMTIDEMKEMAAEEYEGMELSFADGKVDLGSGGEVEYTQGGGDIIVDGEVVATVKGNKLIMEYSDQGVTSRIIFVQK